MTAKFRKSLLLLTFLGFLMAGNAQSISMKQQDSLELNNKVVPDVIWREAYVALSHYPELKDTPIEIKFKQNIRKSFMQAQPKFGGLFKKRKNRGYVIFISKEFTIEDEKFEISSVPSEVLVGWIGHELGHIMDYKDRKGVDLVWFGLKYLTSKKYIREAERIADTYAVNHGLGQQIIATKNFILNHSKLSANYKSRIEDLYLSQEEIMVLIDEIHQETH